MPTKTVLAGGRRGGKTVLLAGAGRLKKRNAQDATLRNIRAALRKLADHTRRLDNHREHFLELEQAIGHIHGQINESDQKIEGELGRVKARLSELEQLAQNTTGAEPKQ